MEPGLQNSAVMPATKILCENHQQQQLQHKINRENNPIKPSPGGLLHIQKSILLNLNMESLLATQLTK